MSALLSDTISRRRLQSQLALPMALVFLFLPGCVVQEIHKELAATRAGVERLAELAPALKETNAALNSSNAQLERLYGELAKTHRSLELVLTRLDTTNEHMDKAVQQLRHLDPIMASLMSLDESLAALRTLVDNIERAIPLLGLTKGNLLIDDALISEETMPSETRRLLQSQHP